jgi:hypothetical protein
MTYYNGTIERQSSQQIKVLKVIRSIAFSNSGITWQIPLLASQTICRIFLIKNFLRNKKINIKIEKKLLKFKICAYF